MAAVARKFQHGRKRVRRGATAHRQGQILVITLLAMALLVGLIFYVFNVGDQVNRRLELQNAADSAVVSGAGWMARSMNLVAMNNITQARMIALALVLDSLPLAAEMTVAEETGEDSLAIALEKQLGRDWPKSKEEPKRFVYEGLSEIYRQMQRNLDSNELTDLEVIEAIDRTLDQDDERSLEEDDHGAYNVKTATEWGADPDVPSGDLWRAAKALDDLSQAVIDSAGELSQASARRFARESGVRSAVLVLPQIPAERGRFADFQPLFTDHITFTHDPYAWALDKREPSARITRIDLPDKLRKGNDVLKKVETVRVSGGAIPDFQENLFHRLGPFAKVYEWRGYRGREQGEWYEDDYEWLRTGYRTYGPLEHALKIVLRRFGQDSINARTTRFAHHVRKLATLKLAYLCGLRSPQRVQYAKKWMHDYGQAMQFAKDNPDQVLGSRWYYVRIVSRVSPESSRWLVGRHDSGKLLKTFYSSQITSELSSPIERQPLGRWITYRNGLWKPPPAAEKERDHVWSMVTEQEVKEDRWFNYPPRPTLDQFDKITGYDTHTIWRAEWWVWGGIEIRDEVEVSNPLAGVNVYALPAPYLLDHSYEDVQSIDIDGQDMPRVRPFSFLAVAHRSTTAKIWPQQFDNPTPSKQAVAVAQAKLFNNQSWDLWTQNWQVRLSPVTGWADWAEQLNDDANDLADANIADANDPASYGPDLDMLKEYMRNLPADLADKYLHH